MPDFALLSYSTDNIGDDIQSLAVSPLLPDVDRRIDRDGLGAYTGPPTNLVLNGWFGYDLEHSWPPAPQIRCLPISMHVSLPARPRFAQADSVAWLKANGPVGCRDASTLEFMRTLDVEAYFSGCATTLFSLHAWHIAGETRPIIVDLPAAVHATLPDWVKGLAEYRTHRVDPSTSQEERWARATAALNAYSSCRLIITGRLHVALPCAAMRTAHILAAAASDCRLQGLESVVKLVSDASLTGPYAWPLFGCGTPAYGSAATAMATAIRGRIEHFIATAKG